MPAVIEQIRSRVTPGGLLRMLGVLVVIAGMCSFLLEEWQTWNDIGRYYVIFAGSCLFAVAGLLMSYGLRDNTGARAFFALALIAVVTNFTTLGGLIHSLVQWDAGGQLAGQLPGIAQWQSTAVGGVLLALLLAYLVQIPLAGFAFKVLARKSARHLTFGFAAMNTLLLVPVRESLGVGLLVAGSVLLLTLLGRSWLRGALGLKTLEGRAALAALAAPVVIMIARSLWLYEADALLLWIFTAIGMFAVRGALSLLPATSGRSGMEVVAWGVLVTLATANSIAAMVLLQPLLAPIDLTDSLRLSLFGFVLAGTLTGFGYQQRGIIVLAGFVLAAVHMYGVLLTDDLLMVLMAVLAAGLCVFAGQRWQQPVLRVSGIVLALAAILPQLMTLLGRVDFSHWLSLTLIGISAIGLATVWEKRRSAAAAAVSVESQSTEALQYHHRNTPA